MYTEPETKDLNIEIANTILQQIGGKSRVSVMTGAKDFYATDKGLQFKLPSNITKHKINKIKITLEPTDTYKLEFFAGYLNRKTYEYRQTYHKTYTNIYFDQLIELLESETGLFFHL